MALGNTEEFKTEVLKLWDAGKSSSAIADILAERGFPKKSRNAIGGIIDRARRKGNAKAKKKERTPAKPKAPKALPGRPRQAKSTSKSAKPLPDLVTFNPEDFPKVTLMELRENHCRWPIGEPGHESFRFCGAPKSTASYCSCHAQIAYQPTEQRRRYPR